MIGTIINVIAIASGGLTGLLLRKRLPARMTSIAMQGLALVVALIGVEMMLHTRNAVTVLLSMVIGGVAGEFLGIEDKLERFGKKFEERFGSNDDTFAKAFVTASLLFCVGPMSIIGALEDGLRGNYTILLTKATLDGISAVAFASSLGFGVIFAAIPVLLYQGGITLCATLFKGLLTATIVDELTATGGLLILGISVNLLQIKKIKISNFLPALLVAVLLAAIYG